MAGDDQEMQGAKSSSATILTYWSWKIQASEPEGLTHLPLVPHIVNRDSIGSDNGLSPIRRQSII